MSPGAWRATACAAPLLLLAWWTAPLSCVAAPGGARALLDHALRATHDATATFHQTRTDALGTTRSRGRLEYRKPRRLRLEWLGTVPATAIVNDDSVWFYQPAQKSVLKGSAAAGGAPPALFLEESVAALERTYRVRADGATGLVLEPRDVRAPWARLALALDPQTGWPRRLTLSARDGTRTTLEFGRFRTNRGSTAARFAPRFPRGTTVVEL